MIVGLAAAIRGHSCAPTSSLQVFGDGYEEAVPVVQLMLFVMPFVYASNPLLAHLYTSGKEHSVLWATLAASVVGTAGIVVGQVSFGASGAAAGYVARQALFALALSAMVLLYAAPRAHP